MTKSQLLAHYYYSSIQLIQILIVGKSAGLLKEFEEIWWFNSQIVGSLVMEPAVVAEHPQVYLYRGNIFKAQCLLLAPHPPDRLLLK